MKQFYCRIGSKAPLVKTLLQMIPPHTLYVEPFVGGGSLYFAKNPLQIQL